jgi:transposase
VVKSELTQSERTYSRDVCSLVFDRDLNATINLAHWRAEEPPVGKQSTQSPALLVATA